MLLTNTITNASPGPVLHDQLSAGLTAEGYSLVDTVIIGARTHKVWLSPAENTKLGKKWYLDISYPTTGLGGTFGLMFCAFEDYDPITHLGYRGCYANNDTTNPDPTYFSRYGTTGYALETNWANSAGYTTFDRTLSSAAFQYWCSITPDRIILYDTIESTYVNYCGFFEPNADHVSHAGAALYPLVHVRLLASAGEQQQASTQQSAQRIAFTRVPRLDDLSNSTLTGIGMNWGWFSVGGVELAMRQAIPTGLVGYRPTRAIPNPRFAQLPVFLGFATPNNYLSENVGTLDGLVLGWIASAAVRGDTVTVGSVDYYITAQSTNLTLLMSGE